MLLFKLTLDSFANRPLVLHIKSAGKPPEAEIDLDVSRGLRLLSPRRARWPGPAAPRARRRPRPRPRETAQKATATLGRRAAGEGDEPASVLPLLVPELGGPRLARDLDAGNAAERARPEADDADHEPAQRVGDPPG